MEREYIINLNPALKAANTKRASRATTEVRLFVQRHMKSEDVWMGPELNELIWQHGRGNFPRRVRVRVVKDDAGKVYVNLHTVKILTDKEREEAKKKAEQQPKKEKKAEAKKTEKPKKEAKPKKEKAAAKT